MNIRKNTADTTGIAAKNLKRNDVVLVPVVNDGKGRYVLQAAFANDDHLTGGKPSMRIPQSTELDGIPLYPGQVFIGTVGSIAETKRTIFIRGRQRTLVTIGLRDVTPFRNHGIRRQNGKWILSGNRQENGSVIRGTIGIKTAFVRYGKNTVIETARIFTDDRLVQTSYRIYTVTDIGDFSSLPALERQTYADISRASRRRKRERITSEWLLRRIGISDPASETG